jgi:hypothetical protein
MVKKQRTESVKATQGEKMIEVKIRLWTNDIAPNKGDVIPKHAWASGVVMIERNNTHSIEPKNPKPFHSLLDVGSIIEKVLIEHEIMLHPGKKMKKYIAEE